ncbi:MAG: hypothetical protein KC486_22595 [Myxococcales bacterium]|nr:hypothetical protein [Myxococcales bacterium]
MPFFARPVATFTRWIVALSAVPISASFPRTAQVKATAASAATAPRCGT